MFVPYRNRQICILLPGICFAWFALSLPCKKDGSAWAADKQDVANKSAPFWQKKAVQDWSPEEVQLFLCDSPWAKTERIAVSIKNAWDPAPMESPPVVGAAQMKRIETCCRTFEVPMPGPDSDSAINSPGRNSLDFQKEPGRTWSFSARVFWISSVSIRRAVIRQRQLQGVPMNRLDAALAPSTDFVLALSGSFLKLLEGLHLDEVKTMSFLKAARGTRRKLLPAEYIPAKPDADQMAFLIFPKTVGGKPALSRENGSVTFFMKGKDFSLECRFPLEPMVVDGKVDW